MIWPVELLVIGEFPVEASLREAKDHQRLRVLLMLSANASARLISMEAVNKRSSS